jgi:hypothetical protein
VTAENTASKAIGDRMLESAQITANRTRAQIGISIGTRSYLAIKWQRGRLNARCASTDRRFPTPQPTTTHLFWPNQRRKAALLLPIWLRSFNFVGSTHTKRVETGGGGLASRSCRKCCIDKLTRNFIQNGLRCPIHVSLKKDVPRNQRGFRTKGTARQIIHDTLSPCHRLDSGP